MFSGYINLHRCHIFHHKNAQHIFAAIGHPTTPQHYCLTEQKLATRGRVVISATWYLNPMTEWLSGICSSFRRHCSTLPSHVLSVLGNWMCFTVAVSEEMYCKPFFDPEYTTMAPELQCCRSCKRPAIVQLQKAMETLCLTEFLLFVICARGMS